MFFSVVMINVPIPGGLNPFELWALLSIVIFTLHALSNCAELFLSRLAVTGTYLFFMFFVALSALWNDSLSTLATTLFATFAFLYVNLDRDVPQTAVLRAVFLSGLTGALVAAGQKHGVVPQFSFSKVSSFRGEDALGFTGLIPNRGMYGITLEAGLAVLLYLISEARRPLPLLFLFCLIFVFLYAAFISLSRSTMVACATVIFSYVTLRLSFSRIRLAESKNTVSAVYFVAIGLLIIAMAMLSSGILSSISNRLINIRPDSVQSRFATIHEALGLHSSNFLLGTGQGVIESLGHPIHNSYVAVLIERGAPAMLFFVLFNLLFFYKLTRRLSYCTRTERSLYSALLAGFLGVQVEMNFFRGYTSIPYWAYVALVFIFLDRPNWLLTENRVAASRQA